MKPTDQRQSEARRQHIKAIVARHVRELFKRLPMLSASWPRPDLEADVSVFTCPGRCAERGLYKEIMRSLVALAEKHTEAVQLMRGHTVARALR